MRLGQQPLRSLLRMCATTISNRRQGNGTSSLSPCRLLVNRESFIICLDAHLREAPSMNEKEVTRFWTSHNNSLEREECASEDQR